MSDKSRLKFDISQPLQAVCIAKGQLISKRNSEAEDSPKKRTNEFVFTSMRRVFVCFLGESSARKKSFREYLTFKMATKIDEFFTVDLMVTAYCQING